MLVLCLLSRSIDTSRPRKLAQARRLLLCSSLLVATTVLASAGPSLAAERTTQPGTTLRVFDTLETGGHTGLVPARGGGTRGEVAIFTVRNTGKKSHDFAVLGKKTPALRHGRRSVFSVVLLRRGSFPFQSTLDKGNPGFRGVFVVR